MGFGAPGSSAEYRLGQVLDALSHGRMREALEAADALVARYPTFRLAHLVRGDLLRARARPGEAPDAGENRRREQLKDLRAEMAVRLRAAADGPPPNGVPRYLIQLAQAQRHAIVVDASRARIYLYKNASEAPQLVASYYASIGKPGTGKEREGDRKTPLGVYRVTSQIPGRRLPDLYGWGAFPLDYPNEWDRLRGRSGHGIWIHGVPANTYARPPRSSDGCVALANPEIAQLASRVESALTPVIIADRADWLTRPAWRAERDTFRAALERWRVDWESRDAGRYFRHYASSFRSGGMNPEAWRRHKRRVNETKSWIRVSLSSVSIFRDPGPQPLMVVTFDQDYRSSNFAQRSHKQQYWIREGTNWKIALETVVARRDPVLPESFPAARRAARAGGAS